MESWAKPRAGWLETGPNGESEGAFTTQGGHNIELEYIAEMKLF